MNWEDDPELRNEMHRRGVRGRLVRSAIIWTPIFLVVAGLLVFYFFDTLLNDGDRGGTWVLVVVLSILSGLFGFQSIQSLLDLRGAPQTERGVVLRRWARTDSLVMKSHYIRVDKYILRGDAFQLADIHEGDHVEVTFYPRSATLIWAEKLPATEDKPATV